MDIAKLIIHQARSREHEPAIAFSGGIATYGMLVRAVASAGERLDLTGLQRGAIVALDLHNPFHQIALILALELRGMASASVQTAFSVQQSGLVPAAILVDAPSSHDGAVPIITIDGSWFTTDLTTPAEFDRLMALPGFADDEALARVVFSSGATGVPKSTGLTPGIIEKRIGHNAMVMASSVQGMRIGTMMGFSTLPGYMLPMTALVTGGVVCIGGSPAEMLHLVRSLRVDILMTAVAQLNAMLGGLGTARPPALSTVIVSGSRIPQELLAKARERLCANITFIYGSTEAGMIAQAPASLLEGQEGVAGYLMPWVKLQVVDADDQPLPFGAEGVIRLQTPEQAYYLADDPQHRSYSVDGWFYPGDVGRLRADGLVQVTGRSVEVIDRGGSMVAPDLIEQILRLRPEITDAVAFGVPGKGGLEDIWAAVVSTGEIDEAELIAFCREKLADKTPGTIRRIAAVPRTETGKIRRQQVRDALTAG